MYQKITFFPGLNALRFFAAYLVVIHHMETIRMKDHLYDTPHFSLLRNGGNGVYFFFVLSGFLITYLLLREYRKDGTISVRKFYMRRILRIWPLYFLLVVIGLFLVPALLQAVHFPYVMPYTTMEALPWYLIFMPFIVNLLYGTHLLSPLWSIGVEELFYAVWAPLFKFLRRNIIAIVAGILILKTGLTILFYAINPEGFVYHLLKLLAFECMSIGALGAIFLYYRRKAIEQAFCFTIPGQVILFLILFGEIAAHGFLSRHSATWDLLFNTPVLSALLRALLFCWLILNVSVNQHSLMKLKNRVLDYLGKISYGIYMYQMLVIFSIVYLIKKFSLAGGGYWQLFLWNFLVLVVLVAVAAASKSFFEDYFLRLKNRFETGVKNNKKAV